MIELDFAKSPDGLLPVVAQDWRTGEVLMLAYVNRDAFEQTLATGLATYWSRSRQELWVKGATSGHTQKIHEVLVDCDNDTVLYKIEQLGGSACHAGYRSCFFRKVENGQLKIIADPIAAPIPHTRHLTTTP
jgi:phosphoribosyl-AMP cyclohydrolase